MDLHLIPGAVPTEAERAAVDLIVGPAESEDELFAGRRAARGRRQQLLPVLHSVQRHIGFISAGALNYLCQRLSVPPAEAYGVASFYAWFRIDDGRTTDDGSWGHDGQPAPTGVGVAGPVGRAVERTERFVDETASSPFALRPSPCLVHVCDDIACRISGAMELIGELRESDLVWKPSPCLGLCEQAPAALVQRFGGGADAPIGRASIETIREAAASSAATPGALTPALSPAGEREPGSDRSSSPFALRPSPGEAVTGVPGTLRVWSLSPAGEREQDAPVPPSAFRLPPSFHSSLFTLHSSPGEIDNPFNPLTKSVDGSSALRAALRLGREGVIREVVDSKLLGRGGAAFPTGRKWEDVARAAERPHYLVCNADESEPGTFKDRVIMEEAPELLVEAMTIAGFATDCQIGYIYLRAEYPVAAARLQRALEDARRRGMLGDDILGQGVRFDIEIRRGAGAYICGEETALFNSIEGYRGEPRNKPPYPTRVGLFGKPTLVNNVETLINIPEIVLNGGIAYAATGTEGSAGSKLFCVSGRVARPGAYRVPFGTTLRQLLDLAGGVRSGRPLRAILLGGAAGSFVTPDELDVPLTFEGTRAIGASLGSGVVLVLDDTVDLADVVRRIAAFFRDESCGQCVPCRVGTVRQEEALVRLISQRPLGSIATEITLIDDVGLVMRDASICGLGQTASSAVQSAIHKLGLFR